MRGDGAIRQPHGSDASHMPCSTGVGRATPPGASARGYEALRHLLRVESLAELWEQKREAECKAEVPPCSRPETATPTEGPPALSPVRPLLFSFNITLSCTRFYFYLDCCSCKHPSHVKMEAPSAGAEAEYDIDGTAAWITAQGLCRVALQLPVRCVFSAL